MTSPKLILTHRGPDLDAIVSAWLAERFLFADEPCEVQFVSVLTDKVIRQADCIVDIGKFHNRGRLRFDHKGVECLRHITCSAKLLWRHLRKTGHDVDHLRELVELVHDGDSLKRRHGSSRYRESRQSGLHALLADLRGQGLNDHTVYHAMSDKLDAKYAVVATT
jgi:hypothetical protein